jgi:hypothetical protein
MNLKGVEVTCVVSEKEVREAVLNVMGFPPDAKILWKTKEGRIIQLDKIEVKY